jgi:hypothetical protein
MPTRCRRRRPGRNGLGFSGGEGLKLKPSLTSPLNKSKHSKDLLTIRPKRPGLK